MRRDLKKKKGPRSDKKLFLADCFTEHQILQLYTQRVKMIQDGTGMV